MPTSVDEDSLLVEIVSPPTSAQGDCPSRETMCEYLMGRLPADTFEAVDVHLATCALCQVGVTSIETGEDSLITQLHRLPSNPNLGEFELLLQIGRGGMGEVYKARQRRLGRHVAVKIVNSALRQAPHFVARFQREMESLGRVNSPHVVQAIHAGEHEGILFCALELIEGANLCSLVLSRGSLSLADSAEVIGQAALGLQAMHAAGLVHRDVHPGNLLLGFDGMVRVADLGLVAIAERSPIELGLTHANDRIGTESFMAPEQWRRPDSVTSQADWFSLGCVWHYLLTGRVLPRDPLTHEISGLEEYLKQLPRRCAKLLRAMLAVDPATRPANATEIMEQLRPLRRHARLIDAVNGRTIQDGTANTTRRRTVISGGILLLISVVAWLVLPRDRHEQLVTSVNETFWEPPIGTSLSQGSGSSRAVANPQPLPPNPSAEQDGWPVDAPPPAIAPFDADQAQKLQEAWAEYLGVKVEYTNSLGMKFRLIPPGIFVMGSTQDQIAFRESLLNRTSEMHVKPEEMTRRRNLLASELPQHRVKITKPFYLGTHEVTQMQFLRVVGVNPATYTATGYYREKLANVDTSSYPVDSVSWFAAIDFCKELTEKERGQSPTLNAAVADQDDEFTAYRLPTEAEWEWSCRAGTTTLYWTGDNGSDLPRGAWIARRGGQGPKPVGQLAPNPFGLYDTHGNQFEWCNDWWELRAYAHRAEEELTHDPVGASPDSGLRIFRGGDWEFTPWTAASSYREAATPVSHSYIFGFRAALSVDAVQQAQKVMVPGMPNEAALAPDRLAAEWILFIGGTVSIKDKGQARQVDTIGDLPQGEFKLTEIKLNYNQKVSDAGLAYVKNCKSLIQLYLYGTQVSDAGLAHFEDCENFVSLTLGNTKVTDSGLVHFKNCKKLSHINLHGTLVGDAGLVHFKDSKHLMSFVLNGTQVSDAGLELLADYPKLSDLFVRNTKVTEAGVKKLSAALPNCKIEWDGSVIEPQISPTR